MKNNFLLTILTFIRNLFKHGNFETIDTDFDLLTEKGEMAVIKLPEPKPAEEFNENSNEQKEPSNQQTEPRKTIEFDEIGETDEINPNVIATEPEYEFDDETLKRIYQTLKQIKAFEEKVNKLRNIKFVRRDKNV